MIPFHIIAWILFNSTPFNSSPINCNHPIWHIVAILQIDHFVNCPVWQECLCVGFAKTSPQSVYTAGLGISPLWSVGTIVFVVLTPSATVSFQFVIDMEWYDGISSSPDFKPFTSIGPSTTRQYSLLISVNRHHIAKYTIGRVFLLVATAAPCLDIQCLVFIDP